MLHILCALLLLFSFSLSFSNEEGPERNQISHSWTCTPCNMTFANKFTLKRHLERSKRHNPNLPRFTCNRCQRTLSTKFGLKRHRSSKQCSSMPLSHLRNHSANTNPSEDSQEPVPLLQDTGDMEPSSTTNASSLSQQAGAYGPIRHSPLLGNYIPLLVLVPTHRFNPPSVLQPEIQQSEAAVGHHEVKEEASHS